MVKNGETVASYLIKQEFNTDIKLSLSNDGLHIEHNIKDIGRELYHLTRLSLQQAKVLREFLNAHLK